MLDPSLASLSDTLRDEAYACGRVLSSEQIASVLSASPSLPSARRSLGLPRPPPLPLSPPLLSSHLPPSDREGPAIGGLREALDKGDRSILEAYRRWIHAAREGGEHAERKAERPTRVAAEREEEAVGAAEGRVPSDPVEAAAVRVLSELRMMEWTLLDLDDALLIAARERKEAREEAEEAAAAAKAAALEEEGAAASSDAAATAAGGSETATQASSSTEGGASREAPDELTVEQIEQIERSVREFIEDKRAWVEAVRAEVAAPRAPGAEPLPTAFNVYVLLDGRRPARAGSAAAAESPHGAAATSPEAREPPAELPADVPEIDFDDARLPLGLKCLVGMEQRWRSALRCFSAIRAS